MATEFARRACLGVAALALLFLPIIDAIAEPIDKEIYQDFRGSKPLIDDWKLIGNKTDKAGLSFEEKGMRISIPKTRDSVQLVGVRLRFPASGDFEITARYEFLILERPMTNQVAGFTINLVDGNKGAKLGRYLTHTGEHMYRAEKAWPETPRLVHSQPTKALSGQLRMVRQGASLRYLVAEGTDDEFQKILETEFTADELPMVRLGANNNSSKAAVDVRIIDIRLRPVTKDGVVIAAPRPVEMEQASSRGWVMASLVIGLVAILLLGIAAIILIVLIRRQRPRTAS